MKNKLAQFTTDPIQYCKWRKWCTHCPSPVSAHFSKPISTGWLRELNPAHAILPLLGPFQFSPGRYSVLVLNSLWTIPQYRSSFSVCLCACVHVCENTFVAWRSDLRFETLPSTSPEVWPAPCCCTRLAGPRASRDCTASISCLSLGTLGSHCLLLHPVLIWFCDLNSDPNVCVTSTSPTEPSPQSLKSYHFKSVLGISLTWNNLSLC